MNVTEISAIDANEKQIKISIKHIVEVSRNPNEAFYKISVHETFQFDPFKNKKFDVYIFANEFEKIRALFENNVRFEVRRF